MVGPVVGPVVGTVVGSVVGTVVGAVAGNSRKYKVWIVYENGRAYPDYLVRYYCGRRDPTRTPYSSQIEAQMEKLNMNASFRVIENVSRNVCIFWEFQDDLEWKGYSALNQGLLESAYISFCTQSGPPVYHISTDKWRYQVSFCDMRQTNTQHPARKQRSVRRSIENQRACVSSVVWEFHER